VTSIHSSRRVLLVHAHPDDECIGTGAMMAKYAAAGAQVTLVTCTLGEEGEILVPELAQLEAAQADQLGGVRIGELATAMSLLGITDHRFLGGAGRFRDSGMMDTPANQHPRAFWNADHDGAVFDAAVAALVDVILEIKPQVVITYDDFGGYGHPDHIMAHRVATQAVARAASTWQVSKFYWTAMPRSVMVAQLEAMKRVGSTPFKGIESVDDIPFIVEDSLVTTAIVATDYQPAKMAALAAHKTQVSVDGPFFALSNDLGQTGAGVEYLRLMQGELGLPLDEDGRETDIFAGIHTAGNDFAGNDFAGNDFAGNDFAGSDTAGSDTDP
jgi:N-acetyl-1-D-myo-inositol-2-amino-2-deoxy-alpha-D-glucopyranoside deacetylase